MNDKVGSANGGYDFADVMARANQEAGGQDVPPVHPFGDVKYISEEEYKQSIDEKFSRNLFPLNNQFRSFYGQFHLQKPEDLAQLEEVNNNCLQKGWIMAKEDWGRDKEGNMIVVVKCLIPEKGPDSAASRPTPPVDKLDDL